MITAVMIDSREPEWVQKLDFGAPSAVIALDYGDLHVLCDDGATLVIERKTPDDLLGTLQDDRLFRQVARMARRDDKNEWPYLVITGELRRDKDGKVITDGRGRTGWDWAAVQGALLTVQELGVPVVYAGGDADYAAAAKRLSKRNREGVMPILPPRTPSLLGPAAGLLASLPRIGPTKAMELLKWSGGNLAWAIVALTDPELENCPIGQADRRHIRRLFGLRDEQEMGIYFKDIETTEQLTIYEKQ